MEPIDESNEYYYHRLDALNAALQFRSTQVGTTAGSVIEIAEYFLRWLKKES